MTTVPGQSARWSGVSAAVFYGVLSGSMSFVNKVVLSTLGFHFPCFIMLCQMILTASVFKCLGILGHLCLPPATFTNLKLCWLPSILGLFHSVLSLHALGGMNVAMYTILKRCVPLMNLLLTPCLLQKGAPSLPVVGSVMVMTAGCVFTGLGDLTFDLTAYTFGMLSVFSQSLYLTLVQSLSSQHETLSAADIAYLNSLNCIPLLLLYTTATSEFTQILDFPDLHSIKFLVAFLVVISMGCALNYSVFLCTTLTSALTLSVVGVMKSVVVVIVGLFTFGGVQLSVLGGMGVTLNTLGSGWYTYAKYQEKIGSVKMEVESATQELVSEFTMGNGHLTNNQALTGIKLT
ncbi:UDP-galactose/UDP-glucose transporter 7-like [Patiria miniata]|uniref:Sugar phosphate transporter domain-containing protein n=1 Tax=Patiria miniata TaxID=46514 RepID=A0A914ABR3_PATMI|nr:UDP-galactose/UDP-glucose transporter 7-like [Patiria miniata]